MAAVFIILGAVFLTTVSYKVVYDARKDLVWSPLRAQCRAEMLQTVPGWSWRSWRRSR